MDFRNLSTTPNQMDTVMQRRPSLSSLSSASGYSSSIMVEILHPIPTIPIPITIVVAIVITTLMAITLPTYQLKD